MALIVSLSQAALLADPLALEASRIAKITGPGLQASVCTLTCDGLRAFGVFGGGMVGPCSSVRCMFGWHCFWPVAV
jgi:hypothetical protein